MSDNKKPLVTVMVPAYNHETWVEETIMSIVNQTYGYNNIQLIVTDDNSLDKTPIILNELAAKYNFELILHKENMGICATLNEMITRSRGKYITAIASDDILFLDKIEKQIGILKENPQIDILVGSNILIDKKGKVLQSTKKKYDDLLTTYNFEDLFLKKKPGFPAGSAIIKKELYERIGTYDPNFKIEDYYFWLKAAYNNANITFCNRPFYYYRLHNSSISSNTIFMEEEILKILKTYKIHPKYNKAIKTRQIIKLSKMLFNSKLNAIVYLWNNPDILVYKTTIKIIIMLLLPKYILRKKFIEDYFRSTNIT